MGDDGNAAESPPPDRLCTLLVRNIHYDSWAKITNLLKSIGKGATAGTPGQGYAILIEFMQLAEEAPRGLDRKTLRRLFQHKNFMSGSLAKWFLRHTERQIHLGEGVCAITLFQDPGQTRVVRACIHEPVSMPDLEVYLRPGCLMVCLALERRDEHTTSRSAFVWLPWMSAGPSVSEHMMPNQVVWEDVIETQFKLLACAEHGASGELAALTPVDAHEIQRVSRWWRERHDSVIVVTEVDHIHNWHATPCARVLQGYWNCSEVCFVPAGTRCFSGSIGMAPAGYVIRVGLRRRARPDAHHHHLPEFPSWSAGTCQLSSRGRRLAGDGAEEGASLLALGDEGESAEGVLTESHYDYACLVCLDREATMVFTPCGHQGVCGKCCKWLVKAVCQRNKGFPDMRFVKLSGEELRGTSVTCIVCRGWPSKLRYHKEFEGEVYRV